MPKEIHPWFLYRDQSLSNFQKLCVSLKSYLFVPFQSLYTIGATGLAMATPLFGPLQKNCKSCSQTLPTPVQIAFSSTRGGGFGDICHVSVFSTGIHAEPIELQITVRCHAIIQLADT